MDILEMIQVGSSIKKIKRIIDHLQDKEFHNPLLNIPSGGVNNSYSDMLSQGCST